VPALRSLMQRSFLLLMQANPLLLKLRTERISSRHRSRTASTGCWDLFQFTNNTFQKLLYECVDKKCRKQNTKSISSGNGNPSAIYFLKQYRSAPSKLAAGEGKEPVTYIKLTFLNFIS
jgi:hypothetical protein